MSFSVTLTVVVEEWGQTGRSGEEQTDYRRKEGRGEREQIFAGCRMRLN